MLYLFVASILSHFAHAAPDPSWLGTLRKPSFNFADCQDRLTIRPSVRPFEGMRVKWAADVRREYEASGHNPDLLWTAILESTREPILFEGSRGGRALDTVFVVPRDVGEPRRVDFSWTHESIVIERVAPIDPVADHRALITMENFGLVRNTRHAFVISIGALADALDQGIDVTTIDEALGRPISPPVASGVNRENVWLIGRSTDVPFLSVVCGKKFGILNISRVKPASRLDRTAYLFQSGSVHDVEADQVIAIDRGIMAGHTLRFIPGVLAKIRSSGIAREMVIEAISGAVGLALDDTQRRGRVRKWMTGELANGLVLEVAVGQESDLSYVIVHAGFTTRERHETCRARWNSVITGLPPNQ